MLPYILAVVCAIVAELSPRNSTSETVAAMLLAVPLGPWMLFAPVKYNADLLKRAWRQPAPQLRQLALGQMVRNSGLLLLLLLLGPRLTVPKSVVILLVILGFGAMLKIVAAAVGSFWSHFPPEPRKTSAGLGPSAEDQSTALAAAVRTRRRLECVEHSAGSLQRAFVLDASAEIKLVFSNAAWSSAELSATLNGARLEVLESKCVKAPPRVLEHETVLRTPFWNAVELDDGQYRISLRESKWQGHVEFETEVVVCVDPKAMTVKLLQRTKVDSSL